MRSPSTLLLTFALAVTGCATARPPPPPPPPLPPAQVAPPVQPAPRAQPDPVEPTGLETWQQNHPEASRELGNWVRNHPEAAERFFTWDGHHPERSKAFVTWTIAHPGDGIDVFVLSHRGWRAFDQIAARHRPAAQALMAWCRRHPHAAESLMNHPRGLEWAGHHLYADYWHLEHPHR